MRIESIRPHGTSRVLLHAVKSYDMGPSGFASHPKGRCAAEFIAVKNPLPWSGSNPQSLGPVASTLTTTPRRRLANSKEPIESMGELRNVTLCFSTRILVGNHEGKGQLGRTRLRWGIMLTEILKQIVLVTRFFWMRMWRNGRLMWTL
jgi:hypothetical protein